MRGKKISFFKAFNLNIFRPLLVCRRRPPPPSLVLVLLLSSFSSHLVDNERKVKERGSINRTNGGRRGEGKPDGNLV